MLKVVDVVSLLACAAGPVRVNLSECVPAVAEDPMVALTVIGAQLESPGRVTVVEAGANVTPEIAVGVTTVVLPTSLASRLRTRSGMVNVSPCVCTGPE